jgi:hypothetical protein
MGGLAFDARVNRSNLSATLGYAASAPAPNASLTISGSAAHLSGSAAFAGHLSDGSRRRGDVAVPSLAASTTLTRTSCSCTTTGAASAKSMTESIRRIRASILYHRIFVGYVTSIRRGDSERSMKSKKRDTVQKKRKAGYILEKVIDYCKMKEKVYTHYPVPGNVEVNKGAKENVGS